MKNLFLFVILGIYLSGFSQKDDATEYFNHISGSVKYVNKETVGYAKATGLEKSVIPNENKRKLILNEIKSAKMELMLKSGFKASEDLQKGTVDFVLHLERIFKDEYQTIEELEKIAEQSLEDFENYMEAKDLVLHELIKANQNIEKLEEDFIATHNVKTSMDHTYQQLENCVEVSKYYNTVYELLYRAQHLEQKAITHLDNKSYDLLEETVAKLKTIATQDLAKANTVQDFRGDASIRIGVEKQLKFYLSESEDLLFISKFLRNKEELEKLEAILKSKKKKERTAAEVNKFDLAKQQYSRDVEKLNKVNIEILEKRQSLSQEWSEKGIKFFDVHVK